MRYDSLHWNLDTNHCSSDPQPLYFSTVTVIFPLYYNQDNYSKVPRGLKARATVCFKLAFCSGTPPPRTKKLCTILCTILPSSTDTFVCGLSDALHGAVVDFVDVYKNALYNHFPLHYNRRFLSSFSPVYYTQVKSSETRPNKKGRTETNT